MTPDEESAIRDLTEVETRLRERGYLDFADYTRNGREAFIRELGASRDRLERLRGAARRVLDCGVGNLSQPQYGRRVEAFDLLDDELEDATAPPAPPRSMTLAAAAQRLGLAPTTLREQVHRGRLGATKTGRDWLVDEAEVERYRAHSLGKPGHPRKP